ncbi:MAG: restriction endonuclease [Candidatus Methanomethyliaceae archaeon]|nr:restriction endonuclease [Candidatus Methanomethyliaceae archaeon]
MLLKELEERMKSGEQLEEILKKEGWRDFEDLTSSILSESGFLTIKNLRFSYNKRRYEIDIIALENPRIIVADCKHWKAKYSKFSALKNATLLHYNRCLYFSYKLAELSLIDFESWKEIIIIPTLVTLYEEIIKEKNNVFIVPLFKITSFLEGLRSGLFDVLKNKSFKLS